MSATGVDTNQLAGRLETLCVSSAAGPMSYYGPSSALSFSRLLGTTLKCLRFQGSGLSMSGVSDTLLNQMPRAQPNPLPDRFTAEVRIIMPKYLTTYRLSSSLRCSYSSTPISSRSTRSIPSCIDRHFRLGRRMYSPRTRLVCSQMLSNSISSTWFTPSRLL
jgi:hypothetical protein